MTKNRYSGVDAYAAFFIGYKAKTLTRMPIFTPDDFEDLQQELMVAYLHAWPSFDPARGDRRSFIKTVVNTRALMLVREVEAQKRWTGAKPLSLSAPVDEDGDIALGDTIADPTHLIMEQNADMAKMIAAMPDDLRQTYQLLSEYSVTEAAEMLGIPRTTMSSRLKKLQKFIESYRMEK